MFSNSQSLQLVLKWLILCFLIAMTVQLWTGGNTLPLKKAQEHTFIQIREALNAVNPPVASESNMKYQYTGDHIRFNLPRDCDDPLRVEINSFGGTKEFTRTYSPNQIPEEMDLNVGFLPGGVYFLKVRCEHFSMTRLFTRF